MREHENEPVPGLPEALPTGERILWQGAPSWGSVARRVFHIVGVSVYLALLIGWGVGKAVAHNADGVASAMGGAKLAAIAFVAIGALAFYAYLIARTTLYTVTNKRVVMRFGVALPITMNIPLSRVEAADLKLYGDGTGDIALSLSGKERQSFVVLWPHVRPWHTRKPCPALRGIPGASRIADLLRETVVASTGQQPAIRLTTIRPIAVEPLTTPSPDVVAA